MSKIFQANRISGFHVKVGLWGITFASFSKIEKKIRKKKFFYLTSLSSHVYGLNGLTFFPTCYKIHSSFFLIRIEGERGRKRENIIWHRVWHYFSDNIESTYYNREFSLAYTNIYPLFLFHLCTRHDILLKTRVSYSTYEDVGHSLGGYLTSFRL